MFLSFPVVMLSVVVVGSCLGRRAGGSRRPMTLDTLPLLPRGVSVHEFSSHNKKGVNGDAGWHLYDDDDGDAVIFESEGPGCLKSMWETDVAPEQTLKFYFDGEEEPRIVVPALDLYQGKHPLFPKPLTTWENVGRYDGDQYAGNCFVPVPFAKSLRITIQGTFSFYHCIYERYTPGTSVATFTGAEDRKYIVRAFEELGEELEPHHGMRKVGAESMSLEPHGRMEVMNVDRPGTVMRLTVEGDGSDDFLHGVELLMQWDESPRPDVLAPIGIFFGAGVRAEEVRSLPGRVEKAPDGRVRMTTRFRMPFWRKGRIALLNRQDRATGAVSAEVDLAPQTYPEAETGYFCALYRDGRTEMGRDWLFCDAIGTGWFIGAVQTMFGSHYCEGDEHFVVDGTGMPQVNGTGSEDYYLGCFWPNRNFNMPFAGCVGDIFLEPGPACYYRYHLEAPIPFYQSLDARIQHGGNSDIVSHYQSVGYAYVRRRPAIKITDFIDIGNAASEKAHGYKATNSVLTGPIDGAYEGNAAWTTLRDVGRRHDGGEISFTLSIEPDNDGVRLRRRTDQSEGKQAVEVHVAGKLVGTWLHADRNPYLRWFDSEFELPALLSRGKKSLRIRLVVKTGNGCAPYTDFRYEALTYASRSSS